MVLWLFKGRLSLSAHYVAAWPHGHYALWNNGGRLANECFDLNAHLWRWSFSLTLWHIGRWSWLLYWLPDNDKIGRHYDE